MVRLLLLPGAAAKDVKETDPFHVSADSLQGFVQTIALEPVDVPADIDGAMEQGVQFGRTVATRLAEAGFTVVPMESVNTAWTEALKTGGGFFDPRTGRRDPARAEKVRSLLARLLRERFRADVCLRISIVVVPASFESGTMKWDGVTRDVGGGGFLDLLLGSTGGRAAALSLMVEVEDLTGRTLYARRTGLQPLRHVVKGKLEPFPPEVRFGDPAAREFALDRNLEPWFLSVDPHFAVPDSVR